MINEEIDRLEPAPPALKALLDSLVEEARTAYQEAANEGFEAFTRRLAPLQEKLQELLPDGVPHDALSPLPPRGLEGAGLPESTEAPLPSSLPPRGLTPPPPAGDVLEASLHSQNPRLVENPAEALILGPPEMGERVGDGPEEIQNWDSPVPNNEGAASPVPPSPAAPPAASPISQDAPISALSPGSPEATRSDQGPAALPASGESLEGPPAFAVPASTPVQAAAPVAVAEVVPPSAATPGTAPQALEPEIRPVPEPVGGPRPKLELRQVLQVVAMKTGFPLEMLDEYLASGARLEISPPKLIEIFKELSERLPETPELDLSRMAAFAELTTLVNFLTGSEDSVMVPQESNPVPGSGALEPLPSAKPSVTPFHRVGELPASSPEEPGAPNPVSASASTLPAPAPAPVQEPPAPVMEDDADDEPAEPEVEISRQVRRVRVSNASGLGLGRLHALETIYILPDEGRVAHALGQLMRAEGFKVEIVEQAPEGARGVIALNSLRAASDWETAARIQEKTFEAARGLVNGLGEEGGLFVAVQDTGGDFGMSAGGEMNGWFSGLPGLVRTVAAEYPQISAKALDLEREGRSAEVLALRILRELVEGGPEVEIGLSADGTRLTQVMEPSLFSNGEMLLPTDAVVVVHGAGQGILTAPLVEMAKLKRLRFVLLGSVIYQEESEDPLQSESDPDEVRKALAELAGNHGEHVSPEAIDQQFHAVLAQREVRRLMRQLRCRGSQVCYFPVDAADSGSLDKILGQVRREWGGIAAVLHSTDAYSQEVGGEESFVQGWRTSVAGIQNLLSLTSEDPLQLVGLLCPSLDAWPRAGRADYAMINEIINRSACAEAHKRGASCVLRSINWAFCDDGTLGSQARQKLDAEGIELIPRRQAGRLLATELTKASPVGDIEVVLSPREAPLKAWQSSRFNALVEVEVSKARLPELEDYQVEGTTAVPAVMVMEWFLRYAREVAGPHGLVRCRDFQQVQGIALPGFDKERTPFTVVMKDLQAFQRGGSTSMGLLDGSGQLRYQATLDQSESGLGLEAAPELQLERAAWAGNRIYGPAALSQGPAFQVIHRVDGVSVGNGVLGRLVPPENAGWTRKDRAFHPAMLDGVTQLASVWGLIGQQTQFLVTSVGEFVQAEGANYEQALRCVIQGLESSPGKLRLNAYLESDGGETVAVLREVECHALAPRSGPAG